MYKQTYICNVTEVNFSLISRSSSVQQLVRISLHYVRQLMSIARYSSSSRGRKIGVLFRTGTKGFIVTMIIYDAPTSFSSLATLILLGF